MVQSRKLNSSMYIVDQAEVQGVSLLIFEVAKSVIALVRGKRMRCAVLGEIWRICGSVSIFLSKI
jgi:hypothetical protein